MKNLEKEKRQAGKAREKRTFAFCGFSCANCWLNTSNGDLLSSTMSQPCPQEDLSESIFEQIQFSTRPRKAWQVEHHFLHDTWEGFYILKPLNLSYISLYEP